jgi:DNA polymerase III epsilon subunit-like protein
MTKIQIEQLVSLRLEGYTWAEISLHFEGHTANACRKAFYRHTRDNKESQSLIIPVKVLILDIETSPILAHVWKLWDNNVALNQVVEDWSILSWSAKWLDNDKIMYMDTRNEKDPRNDKKIVAGLWKLMDEADVIIGQNSKSFDIPKINSRLFKHGFPKPSSFRQIDTLRLAKKHFKFTSNKLEYLSKSFLTDVHKSDHKKFPGHLLWSECLKGNIEAFKEMQAYNVTDILATESLYKKLQPWDSSLNFNVYHDSLSFKCACGSTDFKSKGFVYSNSGKFKRYICQKCGSESVDKENFLNKDKRKSLRK